MTPSYVAIQIHAHNSVCMLHSSDHDLLLNRDLHSTICCRFCTFLTIIITRDLYCAAKCRSKLRGEGHCTSAKRITSILRHVAEAFSPAGREGTILNNHRVISIATNNVPSKLKKLVSALSSDLSSLRTLKCAKKS